VDAARYRIGPAEDLPEPGELLEVPGVLQARGEDGALLVTVAPDIGSARPDRLPGVADREREVPIERIELLSREGGGALVSLTGTCKEMSSLEG
jgi:hypothetical protein